MGYILAKIISLGIGLLILSGCRTVNTNAELRSAPGSANCQAYDLRSWVLALVFPAPIPTETRDCLRGVFGNALEQEKRETKNTGTIDAYDEKQMLAASSKLGDNAYSETNIVDLKVYQRGAEIFMAHRRLIAQASEEVLFQTYVWQTSRSTTEVLNGLKDLETNRKQTCISCPPVQVRFIINYGPTALGPLGNILGQPLVNGAKEAEASLQQLKLDPNYVDAKVVTYSHRAFGSNHVKSLTIDGQIAMVTGANAQRFNDADVNWYDTGYMLAGDVVKGIRIDLINALIRAHEGTEKDGDSNLARRYGIPYDRVFSSEFPVREMMQEPYDGNGQTLPILITTRNSQGIPSQSNNNTQNRAFQAAFYGASKQIRVLTPNLNDDAAIRGLAQASRRGVQLEMILSRRFNCESQNQVGQGGQNAKAVNRLIKEIGTSLPQGANHDIRWFAMQRQGTVQIVNDNAQGKSPEERPSNSHAKFMAVDGILAIVGSANMDTQSWNQSRELNLFVFDARVAGAWEEQVFESNFAIAQAINADELEESNLSCAP